MLKGIFRDEGGNILYFSYCEQMPLKDQNQHMLVCFKTPISFSLKPITLTEGKYVKGVKLVYINNLT